MTFPAQEPIATAVALVVGTNTYVTLAEAETYMAARLHAEAWDTATADDKAKALATATRAIDALPLKYRKTDHAQALAFPRLVDTAVAPVDYQYIVASYDPTVVPQSVRDAQCEEALALLLDDERATAQAQGVTAQSFGNASESYAPRYQQGMLSASAHRTMQPWISGAVRMARPR